MRPDLLGLETKCYIREEANTAQALLMHHFHVETDGGSIELSGCFSSAGSLKLVRNDEKMHSNAGRGCRRAATETSSRNYNEVFEIKGDSCVESAYLKC